MISQTFETESISSNYAKSETESVPETESSVSSSVSSSRPQNRVRSEPKKKLRGVRSFRFLRLSSMRSSSRGLKTHYDNLSQLSALDSQSSEQTSSIEMSDASPNYMKATNSSHAKESFQSSERLFEERKSSTRMPTLKLKRSFTRKLSGGTDVKRKLKSSRSIKLATVKGMRSTRQEKNQYKPSLLHSEAFHCNDEQNSKTPSGNSQRVITKRLSFKPVRILSKMSTFKSRKSAIEKSPPPDSSLHKATCSSTLKDSHFPDEIELPLDGSGSQGVLSTKKVCPYTYCSLHGGHRDNVPPLKRFVSMRRRLLKTQKSMKMENRPVTRSKHSGNTKKGTQTNQRVHNEDPAIKTAHSAQTHSQNVKKPSRDSPVRTHDTQVSKNTGGGTSRGEDEEKMNFRCNAEVLLGETSFPHVSFDEYLNDSLAENGYSLSSFLAIKETSMECCCAATDKDKTDSKVIETAGKDNQVAAQKKIDESTTSILMDDQPEIINSDLKLHKDAALLNNHSISAVEGEGADYEMLGVEASGEKQEEKNSIPKLTDHESSGENLNANELTSPNQHDVLELTSSTTSICSSSGLDALEEEIIAKDKNMGPDDETVQESSTEKESKPAFTAYGSYRMQEGDKKYIKLWHLMYKHAVLDNADKGGDKLPSDGENNEGQGKDDLSFNGVKSPSCQDTDDENENVVELVQKAFDEILLPEVEDISFDNPLKSRGMASDAELQEISQGKEDDGNTSASTESPKEEAQLEVDNSKSQEEEKTAQRMGNKPDTKTPKSWSNLKKLLLLKRFVKALEKVRNLNFRKPRHLPSDANLEAERVHLKHLTAEEKKNVEEWMLDKALQKVISKLAPAQKQRVALLVEAFETILPSQDTELLFGKALRSHKSFEEHADNSSDNPMPEQQNSIVIEEGGSVPSWTETVKNNTASRAVDENGENNSILDENVCLAETKDSVSVSSSTPVDIISTSHDEAPTNEIVNAGTGGLISDSTTEAPSSKSEFLERNFETKNLINASEESHSLSKSLILKSFARSLGSNLVSSAAPPNLLDDPVADKIERTVKAKPETENLEQFPTTDETEIQQEKQNHTGLWYLIYRHMASGIATNDFKPLVDGDDEKETGYDGGRVTGTNTSISDESIPVVNQDMPSNHHRAADSEAKLRQIEAIKIVEEAIDAILPDGQENSPDGQSISNNMISDNSEQPHRTEGVNSEDLTQKEKRVTSGDGNHGIIQERGEEPALKEGNKPLSRSWSNLKKVIMLRRFIKALEKVKKFNPRGPKYLPVEPDPEAEKVNLRHQDMEERKGSEEWMLDHALREVVAKLTPARKRKVELLVEAFETVMPTIKN